MRIFKISGIVSGFFVVCSLWAPVLAQPKKMPVIGWLSWSMPETNQHILAAFRLGLKKMGYDEGRNVKIVFHWAYRDRSKLPSMATDLVHRRVDVIVAGGGLPALKMAKKLPKNIPIVFATGGDPVALGLVKNLARPAGNMTGSTFFSKIITPKVLEYTRWTLPNIKRVAFLYDPRRPYAKKLRDEVEQTALKLKIVSHSIAVTSVTEIKNKLQILRQNKYDALLTSSAPLLNIKRQLVVGIAMKAKVPVFSHTIDYGFSGALLGYGASRETMYLNIGLYTGRILRGTKPSALPVLFPERYKTVINLRTAKRLGIIIPPTLFAIADEVIE